MQMGRDKMSGTLAKTAIQLENQIFSKAQEECTFTYPNVVSIYVGTQGVRRIFWFQIHSA